MNASVSFSTGCEGVDWRVLKASLADDDFDTWLRNASRS